LIKRVAALEHRLAVTVIPGPEVELAADPDQLEQMLINLLRNAAEAMLETAVSGEKDQIARCGRPPNLSRQLSPGDRLRRM